MLLKHALYTTILAICIISCGKDKNSNNQNNGLPPVTSYNVNSIANVQYGQNTNYEGSNEKLMLDIYSPKNASASKTYPLVVMSHSGSFLEGDKEGLATLCEAIAEKGFIAVSINYRLGWDYGTTPSACGGDTVSLQKAVYRSLQDYNAALRFMVHNAGKYFIDTNWIFIGGSSAGAVSAVNTIYVTNEFVNTYFAPEKAELGALKTADNNLTDGFTIKGDINLWGGLITDALITQQSAVPMVAFHGSLDETIPINVDHYASCPDYPLLYGSEDMYNKLVAFGVPAVLHIAVGQGHGPDLYQDPDFVSANIDCFLQGIITSKSPKTGMFNNLTSSCQ